MPKTTHKCPFGDPVSDKNPDQLDSRHEPEPIWLNNTLELERAQNNRSTCVCLLPPPRSANPDLLILGRAGTDVRYGLCSRCKITEFSTVSVGIVLFPYGKRVLRLPVIKPNDALLAALVGAADFHIAGMVVQTDRCVIIGSAG